MDQKVKNLYWHNHSITVEERRERYDYVSCVLWFTGLSAAGKSTLANSLCQRLHLMGVKSHNAPYQTAFKISGRLRDA